MNLLARFRKPLSHHYCASIGRLGEYHAAWFPSTRYKVGQIGVMKGPVFTKAFSSVDVPPTRSRPTGSKSVTTENVRVIAGKVEVSPSEIMSVLLGDIHSEAGGKVELRTGKRNQVVLLSEGEREKELANIRDLKKRLKAELINGDLPLPSVVVASTLTCERGLALAIRTSGTTVQLSLTASGEIATGVPVKGKVGLYRMGRRRLQYSEELSEGSTPLLRLLRIAPSIGEQLGVDILTGSEILTSVRVNGDTSTRAGDESEMDVAAAALYYDSERPNTMSASELDAIPADEIFVDYPAHVAISEYEQAARVVDEEAQSLTDDSALSSDVWRSHIENIVRAVGPTLAYWAVAEIGRRIRASRESAGSTSSRPQSDERGL